METPTSFKGHPLHPILVALPIGLFIFSFISDIIYLAGWGTAVWQTVAFYDLAGGLICALIAAIPGLIDLIAISDPNLKRTGIIHMSLMLVSVFIFAVDFFVRLVGKTDGTAPFVLSCLGIATLLIGGWIGAKLVHVFGLTVRERPSYPTNVG